MPSRVLLIEQEEDVRIGAAEVFAIHGVECVAAASFDEAERIFTELAAFDSVISAGAHYSRGKLGGCVKFIAKPYTADTLLKVSGVLKD